MTSEARFERQLPAILEDLYLGPSPDYRDEVLATAVRTRQRPAWTFPGRWLPMDITTRAIPAARLPWRQIGILALLAVLLAATLAAYIGSQRRVPPPFGIARNGTLTYTDAGDVFVRDSLDSPARLLIGGPAFDNVVGFSPDGIRIAFVRSDEADAPAHLWVAAANGSNPVDVGGPFSGIGRVEWSPTGAFIAIEHTVRGDSTISVVRTDGSGSSELAPGMTATSPSWRPPLGDQLVFRGDGTAGWGLFLVDMRGGQPRRLDLAHAGIEGSQWDYFEPSWSPNGDHLTFHSLEPVTAAPDGNGFRIHVADLDAAGSVIAQRTLEYDRTADDELNPSWLPSGDRLVFQRREGQLDTLLAAPPTAGVEATYLGLTSTGGGGIGYLVSPDGTLIASKLWTEDETWVTDVGSSTSSKAEFNTYESAGWQRLAP